LGNHSRRVEAIYGKSDVPPKFQPDSAYSAEESRMLNGEGSQSIVEKEEALQGAEKRRKELGYRVTPVA